MGVVSLGKFPHSGQLKLVVSVNLFRFLEPKPEPSERVRSANPCPHGLGNSLVLVALCSIRQP